MSRPHSLAHRGLRSLRRSGLQLLGRTTVGTLTRVVTNEPVAAITFDGGPDARWTPQVLDVLRRYDARATFFVIGKYVRKHPDVMRRLVDEGHAYGNHTFDHPCLPLVSSRERRRQLRACAAELAPYGQRERYFRPPYLDQSLGSALDAWSLRYQVVATNLHADDWEDRDSDHIASRLIDGIEPGAIIMLHDAVCDQRQRSREAMIDGLERFLATCAGRFKFLTLTSLLSHGRAHREMWLKRPNLKRLASYERVI